MFINFWYAAALGKDVTGDKPLKVRMLGQNFALFRDSRASRAASATSASTAAPRSPAAASRGTASSAPTTAGGSTATAPARASRRSGVDGKIPARARIDAYPTQEKYGLVFAFLGDLPEAERPPLLDIPEWDRDGWRCINLEYSWNANWERSMEAGLDPAHAEFVHSGMKFAGDRRGVCAPAGDWTCSASPGERRWWPSCAPSRCRPARNSAMRTSAASSPRPIRHGGELFHGANCTVTRLKFSEKDEVCQYMWETPLDEFHVAKHLVSVRSIMVIDPMFDESFNKRNLFVADEDKGVIEDMDPDGVPGQR